MSRQMLACTSPLPIGKSISNPACCIFPQPIKLVLYRGCLILQQSTKSATQCNADKEDSRCAFWWKKNPFNHSTTPACSDFKLFLRICVFVALHRVREVFHRSDCAQCRPKIGGFQFGRGGGKPQLQAQLQHS